MLMWPGKFGTMGAFKEGEMDAKKTLLVIALIVASCAAGPACSKPAQTPPAAVETATTDTSAAALPSDASPPEPARPPAETAVTPGSYGGAGKQVQIPSIFPCHTIDDCTSTKFANMPTSKQECTCQASCTPFVVNKGEASRRKEANERYCSNSEWFAPSCPAPECTFLEFSDFACTNGHCVGIALGE